MLVFSTGDIFYTMERPWLNNQSNISCIPSGSYKCNYLARSGSGKYKKVWHLQAVPDRTGVLIHQGNFKEHSKGCIIIGSKLGTLGGRPAVLGSKNALRDLNKLLKGQGFNLTIIGDQQC